MCTKCSHACNLTRTIVKYDTCTHARAHMYAHAQGQGHYSSRPFGEFGTAIKNVFLVLNVEDWTVVFDNVYTQPDVVVGGRPATVMYFVLLVVIGQMLLVNLFVAAIIWGVGYSRLFCREF